MPDPLIGFLIVMKKGLEVRLYPSKEQRVLIEKTLGCSRFVYNHILAIKKELWEDYKLSYNPNLKSFKEEWNFLNKVPSQALANAYMDCINSFKNFFNGKSGKTNNKQAYPKFHKKGKWNPIWEYTSRDINHPMEGHKAWCCSECAWTTDERHDWCVCGADMRESNKMSSMTKKAVEELLKQL